MNFIPSKSFKFPTYLTCQDGVNNLFEEPLSQLLFKDASLCDKVEQVFAVWWPLHDEDVRVGAFIKVHQTHNSRN